MGSLKNLLFFLKFIECFYKRFNSDIVCKPSVNKRLYCTAYVNTAYTAMRCIASNMLAVANKSSSKRILKNVGRFLHNFNIALVKWKRIYVSMSMEIKKN